MHQKRQVCNFRKYIVRFPSNLLYIYKIGSGERIIKFRIDRTGSDVIMATESSSYSIHCNFEIEYLSSYNKNQYTKRAIKMTHI